MWQLSWLSSARLVVCHVWQVRRLEEQPAETLNRCTSVACHGQLWAIHVADTPRLDRLYQALNSEPGQLDGVARLILQSKAQFFQLIAMRTESCWVYSAALVHYKRYNPFVETWHIAQVWSPANFQCWDLVVHPACNSSSKVFAPQSQQDQVPAGKVYLRFMPVPEVIFWENHFKDAMSISVHFDSVTALGFYSLCSGLQVLVGHPHEDTRIFTALWLVLENINYFWWTLWTLYLTLFTSI